jgi:cathepsin C
MPAPQRLAQLVASAFFGAWHVEADIPVHCLKHEVVGEWELFLSAPSKERTHCDHKTPDREEEEPPVVLATPAGGSTMKVTLHESNHVKASTGGEGTWTMVYDEGFAFNLGKMSYFAFSRFDFVTSLTGSRSPQSTCTETIQGWYSDEDRTKYGCYTARKIVVAKNATLLVAAKVNDHQHSTLTKHSEKNKHVPLPDSFHKNAVLALNQRKSATWTAKVYSRWLGKSLRDLALLQGIERRWTRSDARNGVHQPSVYLQKLRGNSTAVPAALDWRSKDSTNFLEPVMDQGSCGSCYAVAGVRMLSARHRISQKDPTAEPFSISYPMACGEYNQGCKGGYGILIAKWSQDVGLVPESCAPYDADFTCDQYSAGKCKGGGKMWRAANPRYVGGFYGATNEENMKMELFTHGPVTAGFAVSQDFMWYEKGIYSTGHDVPQTGDWFKVDHGVLMIGFGEESGVKYWSLQNSWGADWGEEGYFRFKRGENLGGIESICEAADVVEDEKQGAMVASFVANP